MKVFGAQPRSDEGMLPSIWSYPRFEMLLATTAQSFTEVVGFNQSPYNLTGTECAGAVADGDGVRRLFFAPRCENHRRAFFRSRKMRARWTLLGYGLWRRLLRRRPASGRQ